MAPGPPPVMTAYPASTSAPPDLLAEHVVLAARSGPRRAEDAHRRAQLRERAEPLDELALDPHDPPRVGVQPVGRAAAVEQPLVGGGVGPARAAQGHRTGVVVVVALGSRRRGLRLVAAGLVVGLLAHVANLREAPPPGAPSTGPSLGSRAWRRRCRTPPPEHCADLAVDRQRTGRVPGSRRGRGPPRACRSGRTGSAPPTWTRPGCPARRPVPHRLQHQVLHRRPGDGAARRGTSSTSTTPSTSTSPGCSTAPPCDRPSRTRPAWPANPSATSGRPWTSPTPRP